MRSDGLDKVRIGFWDYRVLEGKMRDLMKENEWVDGL